MSYHLLTLTFVLILATLTFVFSYVAFDSILPKDQFKRWRNYWYIVTLIAFLAGNFWIYIVVCGLFVLYISKREENIFALYFFLLLVIPPIDQVIPVPGINYLFPMNYPRLLSLTLLFPLFLSQLSKPDKIPYGSTGPDKLVLAMVVLTFLLWLRGTTFTDAVRYGVSGFLDVFLPYYTASRVIKNIGQLKLVMTAFVIGCLIVGAIGIFEYRSSWLLYNNLDESLGVNWVMGSYLGRGGDVRALSTTGQPIILGYVLMVALGFYLFIAPSIKSTIVRLSGFVFLAAALFVTLSRGPWVGAVALIIVFLATGTNVAKKFITLATVAFLTLPILQVVPGGHKIINILPFIGTSEQFNVEYRDKLLDRSIAVISNHPFFGVFNPTKEPEMQDMVQGEGIVDIVNAYLGISLSQGLVGLALFLMFFAIVLRTTYKAMKKLPKKSEEHLCGSSLLASLAGVLVAIYTVSTIGVIPIVYWSLAGLMLSYSRFTKMATVESHVENIGNLKLSNPTSYPTTLIRK